MSLEQVHSSSRTAAVQGWTVVYRDGCGGLTSTHVDYDPPVGATETEMVDAVSKLLTERCGPAEIPDVLFVFRGRHVDLIGDAARLDQ